MTFTGNPATVMKRQGILALFCTLALGAFAFQAGSDWITFVAPDNTFSAILPVKPDAPQHSVEKVPIGKKTEDGVEKDIMADVVADIWLTKVSYGLYELGVTDYPVEINISRELELDRDNFLKAIDAKLVSESDISQNGYSGKEFTGVGADYTFKCRVFADHRRAYLVCAAEPTASFTASRVDRFLKAFVITAKPK
jgi:hypothetical protein